MVQLNNTFKQLAVRDESTRSKQGLSTRTKSSGTGTATTPTLQRSTTQLLELVSGLTSTLRRSHQFTPTLQHVKSLLYNKEYLAAFGTETDEGERWREVYFARWTPARAVLYERAFTELGVADLLGWDDSEQDEELAHLARERRDKLRRQRGDNNDDDDSEPEREVDVNVEQREVIMIGSGAGAELLALGSVLGSSKRAVERLARPTVHVRAIDQGSWARLVDQVDRGLKQTWPTLAAAGGESEQEGAMHLDFVQGDLLESYSVNPAPSSSTPTAAATATAPTEPRRRRRVDLNLDLASPNLRLVTILFTITELLLQSRPATLRFLSTLTQQAPKGCHLLVIESAALALIPIGTSGRTYPLGTLLDHALCGSGSAGAAGGGAGGQWEIVKSEETKWFRMPEGAEDVYNREVDQQQPPPPQQGGGGGGGEKRQHDDDASGRASATSTGTGTKGIKVKLENSRVVIRLYRKL